MDFEIIDSIRDIETIAVNTSIRDLDRLKKMYGKGRWRKLKGIAVYGCEVGEFVWRNYTGMRRMA